MSEELSGIGYYITHAVFNLLVPSCVIVALILPRTILTACVTFCIYFYLRHEDHINRSLVARTPALPPDNHLPTRDDFIANEGLRKPSSIDSNDECCITCREVPKDPTQITLCGHVFCSECIGAWHAQENRSCPQCTLTLWRENAPSPSDLETLEKKAKLAAAEATVTIPLTLFTLYLGFTSYTWSTMLFAFVLTSAFVLFLAGYGLYFMHQQRRTQGAKWWGRDLGEGPEQAWRMALTGASVGLAWWMLLTSVVAEVYIGPFVPVLNLSVWRQS